VGGAEDVEGVAQTLLREFTAITVRTVKLSVTAVHLGGFIVSLNSNRDIVHWKMRFHERGIKPQAQFSVSI
jgi:hypothetical protein